MEAGILPDWSQLGDGHVHRLRAGRDFQADVREVIRSGREAAAEAGKRLLSSRDDLGNASFLWVQFVDGLLIPGDPCPNCGGSSLQRTGPSTSRCSHCGSVLAIGEAAAEPPVAGPVTPRVPLPTNELPPGVNDQPFLHLANDSRERLLTSLPVDRLWPLWQACRLASRSGGTAVVLGSIGISGAFVAAAMETLGAPERRVVLFDHTRWAILPDADKRRRRAIERGLRHAPPVELHTGSTAEVRAALGDDAIGLLHIDTPGGPEFDELIEWAAGALAPGGAMLIEGTKIPAAGLGAPVGHLLTASVSRLLEEDRTLVPWVENHQQLLIVRAGG